MAEMKRKDNQLNRLKLMETVAVVLNKRKGNHRNNQSLMQNFVDEARCKMLNKNSK